MNTSELKDKILAALDAYLAETAEVDPDMVLMVDADAGRVAVASGEEVDDAIDSYDIMDLLRFDTDGYVEPDEAACADVAAQY